jgi:acetyl esterase/lipase
VLDTHAQKILDAMAMTGAGSVSDLTPQQMRDAFSRLAKWVDVKDEPVGHVQDGTLPGPGGELRFRIYRPRHAAASPALVYFHGGGCVFGSIETQDGICRLLASGSDCAVISIDYRRAPEHRFPAAVDDAYAATAWVVEHAAELGLAPRRIAVGGDSAGGGLAAVVCQMARQLRGPRLALQVLFCPVMDMSAETPSRRALATGYFLDQATIDWMLKHYCPPAMDLKDPRLSPALAPDLCDLPPAQIHTAEFDPLRDEGEAYAKALRRAGVAVRYTCHEGMIHHFYGMAGAIPYARAAVRAAGSAIRSALAERG